ncbi:DNA polymerase III subunit gamma/tau [Halotalea alkalilenta]|uniref:DNA polymerase III subunit gamma/tau n=1 Tax=Halotalea alkalilenta TaxID=376489 RepID=UPI0004897C20|nr:DNA polymerase III subunit gamma/tau [Halotalea alkalilenta]
MSYQVLARKWRPRTFHELVGQEHVSRALINALDQERLHHAYLFTGTRGVGKTTIARILAKCLNCERGVTSNPCGECQACRAIDEGRFVDLIEVDAASRTKVEDTRELLDNVQYAPTQGRYKVYLIDEVHMLSSHSFNALLKTLEEPPPHVKFLLATTDPQKLPITVLSRCLQFALKMMPPERVVGHLSRVLGEEGVSFDERALWLLGRAADGSMRDALSLTDQAIAFGQGTVSEADVAAMLGTLDHRHILKLAEALGEIDAAKVLAEVAALAEHAPDFGAVLDELAGLFHRLAIAQMVPQALDNGFGDRDALLALANGFTAEDVQLYYQIALSGRADMENAPEPRTALEMTLLRMLAFRPQGVPRPAQTPLPLRGDGGQREARDGQQAAPAPAQAADEPPPAAGPAAEPPWSTASVPEERAIAASSAAEAPPQQVAPQQVAPAAAGSPIEPEPEPESPPEPEPAAEPERSPAPGPSSSAAGEFASYEAQPLDDEDDDDERAYAEYASPNAASQLSEAFTDALASSTSEAVPAEQETDDDDAVEGFSLPTGATIDQVAWLGIFPNLGLGGITGNLLAHCAVIEDRDGVLALRLDPSQAAMNAEIHVRRLEAGLAKLGAARRVTIEPGEIDPGIETPHAQRERLRAERQARAVEALRRDPHIRALEEQFGARLLEASVRSLENDA